MILDITPETTGWEAKPGCPETIQRSYEDGRFIAEISVFGESDDAFLSNRVIWHAWHIRHDGRYVIESDSMPRSEVTERAAKTLCDLAVVLGS